MQKGIKKQSEEKIIAGRFLLDFYNNIVALKHNYAIYINLLADATANEDLTKLSPEQQQQIKIVINELRYYATRVYGDFYSIEEYLEEKVDKNRELEKAYNHMLERWQVYKTDINNMIKIINKLLFNSVMRDLLQNSNDIVGAIYEQQTE